MGTPVLAQDQQEKHNVVLKIYHERNYTNEGLKEYKLLYLAYHCPSVVKVYNIMYNSSGSFVVVSLEDLSKFFTLYNTVDQIPLTKQ